MLWLVLAQLASATNGQVLVYGPTFNGNERTALNAAGYTNANIIVASATTWSGLSTSDFMKYDFIWVGDLNCSGPSSSAVATLYSTRATWQPAIQGRVVVSGADAGCHYGTGGSATFLRNIGTYLQNGGRGNGPTGAYINAWGRNNYNYINAWGVTGAENTHGNDYTVVGAHPVHSGVSTSSMSSWGSTYHAIITTVPSGWDGIGRRTSSSTQWITIARPVACKDGDGDGYYDASCGGDDCDDTRAAVNPGASELCSTPYDDDCDSAINEDSAVDAKTWYRDADGDTFGVSSTTKACLKPAGYADNATDCDDADAFTFPGATEVVADGKDQSCDGEEICYVNADGDGYRVETTIVSADPDCVDPGEALRTVPTLDCDDTDSANYPGAFEVVGDEKDQDCDGGEICYLDADGDGSRSPSTLPSADVDCRDAREAGALQPLDCDDADPLRSPTFAEVAGDLRDGNCDGLELCYVDADEDGHATTETRASAFVTCGVPGLADATVPRDDCDDADPLRNPSMPEVVGDEFDSDCDGTELCFTDADGDGWRTGASVLSVDASCDGPGEAAASVPAPDCDDGDAGRSPGETEVVGDGVDQDCDGLELCYVDADDDGWRPAGGATVASADLDCTDSGEAEPTDPVGDCDDADPYRATGFSEIVGDEIDGDCDGQELCYVDADGDRFVDATAQVVSADSDCSDPGEAVDPFGIPDCDDADASSNPLAYDIPGDGIDQDCDGADAPSPPSACSTGGTGSGLGWLGIGLGVMLMRRRVTGRAA